MSFVLPLKNIPYFLLRHHSIPRPTERRWPKLCLRLLMCLPCMWQFRLSCLCMPVDVLQVCFCDLSFIYYLLFTVPLSWDFNWMQSTYHNCCKSVSSDLRIGYTIQSYMWHKSWKLGKSAWCSSWIDFVLSFSLVKLYTAALFYMYRGGIFMHFYISYLWPALFPYPIVLLWLF